MALLGSIHPKSVCQKKVAVRAKYCLCYILVSCAQASYLTLSACILLCELGITIVLLHSVHSSRERYTVLL